MTAMLFKRRVDIGQSREFVAGRVSVTQVALSAWENNIHFPVTLAQWDRWATALDMRFDAKLIPNND